MLSDWGYSLQDFGSFPDDDSCPICGSSRDWETCWQCHGEGGFHDCGEDCCCCLEPELNEECSECKGRGRYLVCISLPHTPEQMQRHSEQQGKKA